MKTFLMETITKNCGVGQNMIDDIKKVIVAPQWLKDRMRKLRKLPVPSVEEVKAQWAASIEQQRYQGLEDIRKAKYLR
jgi:hypothetical protein